MFATLNLLCLWCLAVEQNVNKCFFANIDLFFYWHAQIIETYIIDLLLQAHSRLRQEFNVCVSLWKKRHMRRS